jgi:hypothetical protein
VSGRDVEALIAFLDSRLTMPYAWGSEANDCISFGDGAIVAQTGRSALEGERWSNKAGALRVLKRVGGLTTALDARFERIALAQAHRGDIAGVPADLMLDVAADELALIGLHPMIVEGATLAAPGPRGLERARRGMAVVAWSVTRRKTADE